MSSKRRRARSRVLDLAEAGQDWGEISAALPASGVPGASTSGPDPAAARPSAARSPGAAASGPDASGTRGPGASASRARAAGSWAGPSHPDASPPVPGQDAVVRRTADGWRVGDDDLPDLTCAMVLADLLAAELPTEVQPAVPAAPPAAAQADAAPGPGRRPAPGKPRHERRVTEPAEEEDEACRLRTTVGQLEHALTARIRVEQAIGVLAERHRIRPRQAFEQLRSAARNRGRRVIDIAADVVASASNPLLQLPEELSRQRSAPRHGGRHSRRALRPE
jgi:ANTAR domain